MFVDASLLKRKRRVQDSVSICLMSCQKNKMLFEFVALNGVCSSVLSRRLLFKQEQNLPHFPVCVLVFEGFLTHSCGTESTITRPLLASCLTSGTGKQMNQAKFCSLSLDAQGSQLLRSHCCASA